MTLLDRTASETFRERNTSVLKTERLFLRAPRFEDAKTIATLVNDRRIAENTLAHSAPLRARGRAGLHHHRQRERRRDRVPDHARDGTMLGGCGFGKLDGEHPEIGYWLGVPFWGKGYATEAARAVIDHAFSDLGHDVLVRGAR